jgi:hypothetical protein
MRLLSIILPLTLSGIVCGSPRQAILPCSGHVKPKAEPGWKKDNQQLLVPLSDKARTGLLNEAAEEGVIRARMCLSIVDPLLTVT